MRRVTPTGLMVMTAREMIDDREAWLRARRFREGVGYMIGSSDIPSILGLPESGTPVKVWHEKVHGLEQPDNPNMMWGRLHEDTISRYWRNRNRSAVRAIGLVAQVARPWAQASLDRAVQLCPLDGSSGTCALEIKTRGAFGSRRFHRDLPDDILAQVVWQLIVSGYDHLHYAILVGGNGYTQGVVRASEVAEIITYVLRKVEAFRSDHLAGAFLPETEWSELLQEDVATGRTIWVGREVEPVWPIEEWAGSLIELDKMLHPERDGILTLDDTSLVTELAELRAAAAALKKKQDQVQARLAQLAAGARFLTVNTDSGPQLAAEYAPRGKSRVDLSMLKERYPAAYDDPEVVSHSTSWQLSIAKPYQVKKPKTQPEES